MGDKAELKALTKSRASARGWVTRASQALSTLVATKGIGQVELSDAISEYDKRLDALDKAQEAMEEVVETEDMDTSILEAGNFRDNSRKPRVEAAKLLASLIKKDQGETDSLHNINDNSVKLPKLELPKFRGDLTQWRTFWDKFQALVHESHISTISKFTYLHSLLEGEALAVIQGMAITNDNYDKVCKLLEERFGRKERIIFAHIQGLLNVTMPNLSGKGSRVSNLWKIQDELLSHIRSLESLGIKGADYGIFMTPVILSRLPHDIRMEWAREGAGKESDLVWLLEFLRKEIERRERSETFKDITIGKQEHTVLEEKRHKHDKSKPSTVSALQSSTKFSGCGFCGKNHATERCWDILNLDIPERQQRIFDSNLCFRCLCKGHVARGCVAKCSNCNGRHHHICCVKGKDSNKSSGGQDRPTPPDKVTPEKSVSSSNVSNANFACTSLETRSGANVQSHKCTMLQTAVVKVKGRNNVVKATLLFDSGSDRSYVTQSLVSKVRPEWVSSEPLRYATFGSGKPKQSEIRNVFKLELEGSNGQSKSLLVVEIPVICAPLSRPSISVKSFGNLEFADSYIEEKNMSVDILIGIDSYWKFVKQGVIRGSECLVAQETMFGWVVSGVQAIAHTSVENSTAHQLLNLCDIPEASLRTFWDLESVGILPESEFVDPVLQRFEETLKVRGNRYEVSLPWKRSFSKNQLLNNERLARVRLNSLSHKLSKEPGLKSKYDEALRDFEVNEIIKEVDPEELVVPQPVFYMPHRPVIKESSKTTKVRPVFDASAKGYNGISLNDCLDTGPSLIPSLVEILTRFRRWDVALTADITKAFLQIGVKREDQDVHRFLWDYKGSVRVMRFLRVPFGNKSSPFLLNATIKHHLLTYPNTRVLEELKENVYVDDWLTGADSEHEACEMFAEATKIMNEACMPLAKWNTNSQVVSAIIYQDINSKYLASDSTKILGMKWVPIADAFSFEGVEVPDDLVTTKRIVLSFLARLFDPLGLLAPFVLYVKVLFQDLWRLGLEWDERVPNDIHCKFLAWIEGIKDLKRWEIPRRYFPGVAWDSLGNIELHSFSDASERGYGACIYLRTPNGNSGSKFEVCLVVAKAKVAPVKRITLPRLELLAALLGARLLVFVSKTLKLESRLSYKCWSDSMIALGWIKADPGRWKPFVANRVTEIQELTDPSNWLHCSGKHNPADLLSRGILADELILSERWLKGPKWLSEVADLGTEEYKLVDSPERLTFLTVDSPLSSPCKSMKYENCSSFSKTLRITGWILRFMNNLKITRAQRVLGDLSYNELMVAKTKVLQCMQLQAYPEELTQLRHNLSVPKTSKIAQLSPFLGEDGLLRIKGRLQLSELAYEEKHPIILPNCHLTKLLIRFQHQILKHAGVNTMISSLRGNYWIVSLRKLAKQVKRECVLCRKLDAPACNQAASPLPRLRIQQAPPFTITGLDYAGPMYCCDSEKRFYTLLFTCAVVRSVHLELTDSLNLHDFLLAFRRFSAGRGMPTVMYSDNAKTFQAADSRLRRIFGHLSPEWKFIVPRAPWWGGWWERLIRSIKSSLKKTLGGRCLTRTELETTLHEVEACVNSRPLTFVGDTLDYSQPLTPSHLLIGRPVGFQPPLLDPDFEINLTVKDMGAREIAREQRLDQFWSKWSKDYLRNLPPTINKFFPRGNIQVGSVVLIREENTPRLNWPLGVVTELFPGKDGLVRSVCLKTTKGTLTRPIQLLHDLEINNNTGTSGGSEEISEATEPPISNDKTVDPDSMKSKIIDDVQLDPPVARVSRAGRIIKPREILDI